MTSTSWHWVSSARVQAKASTFHFRQSRHRDCARDCGRRRDLSWQHRQRRRYRAIQADRNGPSATGGILACVEAMASGSALARQAVEAAQSGRSPILAQLSHRGRAAHCRACRRGSVSRRQSRDGADQDQRDAHRRRAGGRRELLQSKSNPDWRRRGEHRHPISRNDSARRAIPLAAAIHPAPADRLFTDKRRCRGNRRRRACARDIFVGNL